MEKNQEERPSLWDFMEEAQKKLTLEEKIIRDFHGNKPIIDDNQIENPSVDEECKKYFTSITSEEDFIRISIEGGGCSGFQYAFYINEPELEDSDIIINENPKVVTDCESINYMKGAIIRYETATCNQRVYVDNPGAKSSCGCGESFAYDF